MLSAWRRESLNDFNIGIVSFAAINGGSLKARLFTEAVGSAVARQRTCRFYRIS
jgi:hypothetical protein